MEGMAIIHGAAVARILPRCEPFCALKPLTKGLEAPSVKRNLGEIEGFAPLIAYSGRSNAATAISAKGGGRGLTGCLTTDASSRPSGTAVCPPFKRVGLTGRMFN
jgi:hypothetical protein